MEQIKNPNTKFNVNEEEFTRFNSEPKIQIEGRSISLEFVKAVLENDALFYYTFQFFQGNIPEFSINLNNLKSMRYSKHTILKAIETAVGNGLLTGSIYSTRLNNLKDITSEKTFAKKYEDFIYHITIDGIDYNIPVKYFIEFLNLNEEDYLAITTDCNPEKIYTSINKIPKAHFIYALTCFIKEHEITQNYELNNTAKIRFIHMSQSNGVDIQALNKHTKPEGELHNEITINEELREAILKDMPNDLTPLEKAIYIYIKMCQFLSYDDEYYVESRYNQTRAHSDLNYVSEISPSNGKTVCYEFNVIYSRLLSELGINFKSNYRNSDAENYGSSHVHLEYRVDKFLIAADASKTVLQSDMGRAKTGLPLRGLECLNNNNKTQTEFEKAKSKIYSLVLSQKEKASEQTNFDKLLREYQQIHNNPEVSLEEKLDILLTKVNDAALIGIDALGYILTLKNVIFNGYETNNNLFFVIIKSTLNPVDNQKAMASAVFTINTLGLGEDRFANRHFYYTPGRPLQEMTREELQYYFNEGIFSYIETGSPAIPGVDAGVVR